MGAELDASSCLRIAWHDGITAVIACTVPAISSASSVIFVCVFASLTCAT